MNSSSKVKVQRRITSRRDGVARLESERIVESEDGQITSLYYRGRNPETRYLPRERSVWGQIKEAFRLG